MNAIMVRLSADLRALSHGVTFQDPVMLWLLGLAAGALAWGAFNAAQRRRLWAPAMRAILIALFALALANPEAATSSEGIARPAVVDVSASITPTMRAWTANLLGAQLKYRGEDPAIMFAADAVADSAASVEESLRTAAPCAECNPDSTDIAGALERLAADFAAEGGPAVLVTDGWQNRGSAERALARLVAARIRLDIFTPPSTGPVPNVALSQLTLPSALDKAQPFSLGVTVENQGDAPAGGTIRVTQGDRAIAERQVMVAPGSERIDFPVRPEDAGLESYTATFTPASAALDVFPGDDSLRGWVGVGSHRKALILSAAAQDARYLENVVKRIGLEPTLFALTSGEWNGALKGFDVVLLNNVPQERLAPAAQTALVDYVERGGSLMMVGGDKSFGLGGYEQSPIANVMPVVMTPPQREERTRALMLVIDKSGSMAKGDKLRYAKAAAVTVVRTMKDSDLIGVIGFDSQAFVVIALSPVGKMRPYIEQKIGELAANGKTYLMPALQEAERALTKSGAQIKHVVVLTDGETSGTTSQYYNLVSRMRRDGGTTISTIGIGREVNQALLQAITKYGGGGYYQTDSPRNLPEIFLEDVSQYGGQSTMVETEFKPQSVKPDPVLKDYAGRALPPLKGYVSTDLKAGATLSMFVDRNGKPEPIVASWKRGAGKAMAVTTDASGRWSSQWVAANAFAPVWDRLLQWMMPQTGGEQQKIDVALGHQNGHLKIKLTDYAERPTASSHLVIATVTRPDGARIDAVLSENVPGEFNGSFEALDAGTYRIEVKGRTGRMKLPPLAYTVSPAVRAEVPRPAPNYALLEQLASATGGRLNPSPADTALTRPLVERRTSFSAYLIVLAMLLLIGEALVRRITA
ncbi:MAG: VWA domain-containing protein [Candidatus Binataceae bacterium]